MNACIRPGTRRCRSFRWPSTIAASLRTRCGGSADRSFGRARRTSREEERAAHEEPAAAAEERGERDAPATAIRAPSQLGADRGHDLVQVADHRVVGVARIGASGPR